MHCLWLVGGQDCQLKGFVCFSRQVYVEYANSSDSKEAQRLLMGRTFDGKFVVATFYPLSAYKRGYLYQIVQWRSGSMLLLCRLKWTNTGAGYCWGHFCRVDGWRGCPVFCMYNSCFSLLNFLWIVNWLVWNTAAAHCAWFLDVTASL